MRAWVILVWVLAGGSAACLTAAAQDQAPKEQPKENGVKIAPAEPASGPMSNGAGSPRIWLSLVDGTQVVGTPVAGDTGRFEFSFGVTEINYRTVRAIDFSKGLDEVKVKFLNGDTLTGKALYGPLRIKTLFGDLEVPPDYLVSISSDAPPAKVDSPTRGLVLHLPLDGDLEDVGPHRRNGKPMGGLAFVETASGKAAKLNGADAWIVVDNHPRLQLTGSMTLALWMQFKALGGSTNPAHKAWGGEGSISLEANGTMYYYYGTSGTDSGNYATLAQPQAIPPGRWAHVCVVRDMKSMKMTWYINGKPHGEAAAQLTAVAGGGPWTFGNGYNGRPMNGMLKDVRLYSRALSAGEIGKLVEAHGELLSGEVKGEAPGAEAEPTRRGRLDRLGPG
jgi:hypothetical protein